MKKRKLNKRWNKIINMMIIMLNYKKINKKNQRIKI